MSDAITSEPTAVPPPGVPPPVPWDAGDLSFLFYFVFVAFLVEMFLAAVWFETLRATGFFSWYYSDKSPDLADREKLWPAALSFPFQVAVTLLLAAAFLGTRPAALGLHRKRLAPNLFRGLGAAAVLTPLVLGLHVVVVTLYTRGLGVAEQKHPLGKLGSVGLSPVELALWLFTAVIAGPVVEELLFRGLFQPAAGRSPRAASAGVMLALALTVSVRYEKIGGAVKQLGQGGLVAAGPTVVDALAPVLLVLVLFAVLHLLQRREGDAARAAVFGTSVLFAMIHIGVWPSPVALFVLSLGLGWLKEKTQSLVGPIVVHALFNGVSCGLVLLHI